MADDLIFKARDKLTGAEGKLEAFRFAALESLAVAEALEIDDCGVARKRASVIDVDHSGVSVLNLYELCADVFIRNFDILLRSLDALVAFNGNHRLHNNGELQLDAVLAGNGGNVRIGNRDDFQTGSFDSVLHSRAIELVHSSFKEHVFAVHLLDDGSRSMTLAEARNRHLLALGLCDLGECFVEIFSGDFDLQLILVGFGFVGCL